jgi:large subunit ribosomal protein L22
MTTTSDTTKVLVRAEARWVRMSARKARVVLDHIRDRPVPEARTILAFTQRVAAREIEKVLRSAVANAESAHALEGDELVIEAAYADEGPTLKRWRARARGRANRIRKRTCHITIVLRADESVTARPKRRAAVPAQAEAPAAPVAEEATGEPEEKPKPKRRAPRRKKETEGAPT